MFAASSFTFLRLAQCQTPKRKQFEYLVLKTSAGQYAIPKEFI